MMQCVSYPTAYTIKCNDRELSQCPTMTVPWTPMYTFPALQLEDQSALELSSPVVTCNAQAGDAIKSMRLFRLYHSYQGDPASWSSAQVTVT